ncbi:hypothetical protein [Nonomuraea dietziae]|uniref:hypothetical protein n=1 Tax=Nonomuraea dietziae TaxID=65515 RepID=UPI0031E4961F
MAAEALPEGRRTFRDGRQRRPGQGRPGQGRPGQGDGANNGGYTEDKYASAKAIKNVAHIVINEVASPS